MLAKFPHFFAFFLLSASAWAAPTTQAGQVKLLTSIKPIQLIAADMLGDLAQVEVLLPPGSSPHHYSLKPSAIRRIHSADLFIWGGADLELFLTKNVSQLERPAMALLDETDGHPAEPETAEHGHGHEDEHEHAHEEDHEEGHEESHEEGHEHSGDPHFWMTPERALAAADKIKDRLIELYPNNAGLYQQAYERFEQRLAQADQRLQQQLKPMAGVGFFVFHDAFSGFVEHYQLLQLGYFTVDPGRKPGARRLTQIRTALENEQAHCVFVEPQFKAPVVDSLIRGLDIRVGRLDPLASEASVVIGGYVGYLQSLADSFSDCLSGK